MYKLFITLLLVLTISALQLPAQNTKTGADSLNTGDTNTNIDNSTIYVKIRTHAGDIYTGFMIRKDKEYTVIKSDDGKIFSIKNNAISSVTQEDHDKLTDIQKKAMKPVPQFSNISLAFMSPSYGVDNDLSFFSGVWLLAADINIGETTQIRAEIPYAHFASGDVSYSEFQNIYIGMNFNNLTMGRDMIFRAGLFLPVVSPETFLKTGILAYPGDSYNYTRYLPDCVTFQGIFDYTKYYPNNLLFHLVAGLDILYQSEGEGNTDIYPRFLFGLGYDNRETRFVFNFKGYIMLTEDYEFREEFVNSLAFEFSHKFTNITPVVEITLPLQEDLVDLIDYQLKIGASYRLK